MRRLLAAALLVSTVPTFAEAVPAVEAACAGKEFRQLDFWLGDWDASWNASPGTPAGMGSNHITRSYEDCVIEEHFDGHPGQHLMGHSVSVYFAPAKEWRQTWVDNEGGYIDLKGGPTPKSDFVLTTLPRADNKHASRMVFTDIKPNGFTWRWQKTVDGEIWADSWVIIYTRKKV